MDGETERDRKARPDAAQEAEGNSLRDASREAVSEIEKRKDGAGHAGAGDTG